MDGKAHKKAVKQALRSRRIPRARLQYGALCWRRRKGKLRVLLVTSRSTRRWIIPKGWPIRTLGPRGTALREAFEEAGVAEGSVGPALGFYSYRKVISRSKSITCLVQVFAVEVTDTSKSYPEVSQRTRRWHKPKKAARLVSEPELRGLIRQLPTQV